jgi:hypothetical protein
LSPTEALQAVLDTKIFSTISSPLEEPKNTFTQYAGALNKEGLSEEWLVVGRVSEPQIVEVG